MKKILTVIGARPQFIKAAAVSPVIALAEGLNECLVHTGQHYDANMSDIFFEDLGIPKPKHQLGISGGGHGAMTGRMLEGLEAVMMLEQPDIVLIYGDTNSTIAGALAAAKLHIPIAHVEAGLRSFNRAMPEEVNRILTDHCSDVLFTPTNTATQNLRNEGVPEARIIQVGDVMYDAALHFGEMANRQGAGPEAYGLEAGNYVLATVHRQENTDAPDRLRAILAGLQAVARDKTVVLPLHPRTRARIDAAGMESLLQGLILLEPLGYLEMMALERGASVVATDSGGVQKEAFFHRVPCVTLSEETGWTELVDAGWNRLVPPTDAEAIALAIHAADQSQGTEIMPYGRGDAAQKIVSALQGVCS